MADNHERLGFGVFFSSTRAVTVGHKFVSEHQEGAKIPVKFQGIYSVSHGIPVGVRW